MQGRGGCWAHHALTHSFIHSFNTSLLSLIVRVFLEMKEEIPALKELTDH